MVQHIVPVDDSTAARANCARRSPHLAWIRWAGIALGLLALVFYHGSVLRVDYLQSKLLDLHPNPDASEYYAMARAMARGEPPHIQIGFERLPARYPPGYSVLMLPWLKILPEDRQILAPFRTSQTMGLLLLCSVWVFYWKQKQPLGAGVAALLLATLPGFVSYSRAPLSEISGIALAAWAFMAAHLGLRTQHWRWLYLCAFLLGLAATVKTQFILFAPLLSAVLFVRFPRPTRQKGRAAPPARAGAWRTWMQQAAGVGLLFALCASPVFIGNAMSFGHFLQTGYEFWVPAQMERAFSAGHVQPILADLLGEVFQYSRAFTAAHIYGTGAHFTPAYVLLAAIGCACLKERRFFVCAGLAWGAVFGQSLFFYYADGRLFFPLFALLLPLAVMPVTAAVRFISRRNWFAWAPILGLFALAVAGYPSQSGFPPQAGRSQWADALRRLPLDRPRSAPSTAAARALVVRTGHQPGLVLSTLNPVFLNAVLPAGYGAAPLDGHHLYQHSRIWIYDAEDAIRIVRRAQADRTPVYALLPPGKGMTEELSRLPPVAGHRWEPQVPQSRQATLLELVAEPRVAFARPLSPRTTERNAGTGAQPDETALAGMAFVWIEPLHVWVGRYEVTNEEFKRCFPEHVDHAYRKHRLDDPRQPAVNISFERALDFVEWLNENDAWNLDGARYRLPTDREWLQIARCGDGREYPWGAGLPPKYGNYHGREGAGDWDKIADYADDHPATCRVEKSGRNGWGLYGVGGNAWEMTTRDDDPRAFGGWYGGSWRSHLPELLRADARLGRDGPGRHSRGMRLVKTKTLSWSQLVVDKYLPREKCGKELRFAVSPFPFRLPALPNPSSTVTRSKVRIS